MDIRSLEYFLAVAREENITAAAEALHMTQPPLSRKLKELEDELGKQLFIRGKRKITLTEEGILLRKRAAELIDLFEKVKIEISSTNDDINGTVYIGGAESEGMKTIAKVIQTMTHEFPHIHYHLYSGNSFDVIERIDKGLLDFGILVEPVDLAKYNYLKLPYTNKWGLLMRKDHYLADKESIKASDLFHTPLICSRQFLEEDGFSGWLGYEYEKLNIVANYNLVNTPMLLAKEGIGAVVTFENLIDVSNSPDLCFKAFFPTLESGMYIIWKKYQIFSSASELFLKYLQNYISK